jgi:hypothetical protein
VVTIEPAPGVRLEVPDGIELAVVSTSGAPPDDADVPWQAGDGAGLFVTVSEEGGSDEPFPEVFGRWVSAYERDRAAEVLIIARPTIAGASQARAGRLEMTSAGGEALGLVVLMAERPDGGRVMVQVTWPLLGPDRFEVANAIIKGIELA